MSEVWARALGESAQSNYFISIYYFIMLSYFSGVTNIISCVGAERRGSEDNLFR